MGERQATGYSKSFSFDEAFRDAMDKLPKRPPAHPDELIVLTVDGFEEGL
jgi:hypothetical protein